MDSNPGILSEELPPGEHFCEIAAKISSDWKTKFYLFRLASMTEVDDITRRYDDPVEQRLGC